MANLSILKSGGVNQITKDPNRYRRLPNRIAFDHELLDGDNSETLRAVNYEIRADWNHVGETQYDALRELMFANEVLYLDDGDVPPLVETGRVYETELVDFVGVSYGSGPSRAYYDGSQNSPVAIGDFEGTQYSDANYLAIDEDDATKMSLSDTFGIHSFFYHKFKFNTVIDTADVRRLRVKVSCLGNDGSPRNLDGAIMYGWNGTAWIELDRISGYQGGATPRYLKYRTYDATIAQSFVDSSENIRILISSRTARIQTTGVDLLFEAYYAELEINENLSMSVALSHTPELTTGDVVWVKNNTKSTTLVRNHYTISAANRRVSVEQPWAHCNGNTEYFYATDTNFAEASITGDMTIEAFVRVDTVSVDDINDIVRKFANSGQYSYVFRFTTGGSLRFFVSADGTNSTWVTTSVVVVEGNTWIHVAVVYDASEGSATFYKNGAPVADDGTGLPNSIFDGTDNFTVSSHITAHAMDGGIAHVAIYDGKRTEAQLLASYNEPGIDLSSEDDIIAQWHFDDGPLATAIDNSQGDSGRDLTPSINSGDTTFNNMRQTPGTTDPGDEIEVKYNRSFEGDIMEIVERWHSGDPASDRTRELDVVFRTLAPEITGS